MFSTLFLASKSFYLFPVSLLPKKGLSPARARERETTRYYTSPPIFMSPSTLLGTRLNSLRFLPPSPSLSLTVTPSSSSSLFSASSGRNFYLFLLFIFHFILFKTLIHLGTDKVKKSQCELTFFSKREPYTDNWTITEELLFYFASLPPA